MNDLICDILKEVVNLQDIIKTDNSKIIKLHYKSKTRKVYKFSERSLPIVFQKIYMKYIYHQKMLMMSKAILQLK